MKAILLAGIQEEIQILKSKNKERWIVRVLPDFLVHTKPWPSLVFSLVIHLPKELSKVHVCRVSSCFLSGIFYEEKRERREREERETRERDRERQRETERAERDKKSADTIDLDLSVRSPRAALSCACHLWFSIKC